MRGAQTGLHGGFIGQIDGEGNKSLPDVNVERAEDEFYSAARSNRVRFYGQQSGCCLDGL